MTVVVTSDLYDSMVALAKERDRSLSGEVRLALRAYLFNNAKELEQ